MPTMATALRDIRSSSKPPGNPAIPKPKVKMVAWRPPARSVNPYSLDKLGNKLVHLQKRNHLSHSVVTWPYSIGEQHEARGKNRSDHWRLARDRPRHRARVRRRGCGHCLLPFER